VTIRLWPTDDEDASYDWLQAALAAKNQRNLKPGNPTQPPPIPTPAGSAAATRIVTPTAAIAGEGGMIDHTWWRYFANVTSELSILRTALSQAREDILNLQNKTGNTG